MKYFVNYRIIDGKKTITPEGMMDINTDVELTAGDIKTKLKEWFAFPPSKVMSTEELKINNKVLEDSEVVSSKKTGLKYLVNFSGSTESVVQQTTGTTA
jgi:hypothetical protein